MLKKKKAGQAGWFTCLYSAPVPRPASLKRFSWFQFEREKAKNSTQYVFLFLT